MTDHEAALNALVHGDECLGERRVRCELVRGHSGPCWSAAAETWLGLLGRCGESRDGEQCWRTHGHRGEHEDRMGRTWRKRKG